MFSQVAASINRPSKGVFAQAPLDQDRRAAAGITTSAALHGGRLLRYPDRDELAAHLTTRTTATDPADHAWLQAVLALRLANAGRREEALGPAEEATDIYRRLAEANPAAYLPNLAMSWWAYAWGCVKTNSSSAQALDAVTEALGLYQQLAERLPQVFDQQMWSTYHTRADVLDGLGRTNEAAE